MRSNYSPIRCIPCCMRSIRFLLERTWHVALLTQAVCEFISKATYNNETCDYNAQRIVDTRVEFSFTFLSGVWRDGVELPSPRFARSRSRSWQNQRWMGRDIARCGGDETERKMHSVSRVRWPQSANENKWVAKNGFIHSVAAFSCVERVVWNETKAEATGWRWICLCINGWHLSRVLRCGVCAVCVYANELWMPVIIFNQAANNGLQRKQKIKWHYRERYSRLFNVAAVAVAATSSSNVVWCAAVFVLPSSAPSVVVVVVVMSLLFMVVQCAQWRMQTRYISHHKLYRMRVRRQKRSDRHTCSVGWDLRWFFLIPWSLSGEKGVNGISEPSGCVHKI